MIVYPASLACDIIESRSIVLLNKVSVMKSISMFAKSIWCRNMSNFLMRYCMFVNKNFVAFPFQ